MNKKKEKAINAKITKAIKNTQTICFDFDGVIHSYASGWQGDPTIIPDPLVSGIGKVIRQLKQDGYRIVIFTTRASSKEGTKAVEKYLNQRHVPYDEITPVKTLAYCYVDDRAVPFDGKTDGLYEKIVKFKSWIDK